MTAPAQPRLLTTYLRPERRRVAGLGALLVAAMLLPVAGPVLIGRFIDTAGRGADVSALVALAGVFLVVTLAGDALQLLVTWLAVRMAWRVGNRLRADLCHHALGLELAWHGEHSAGQLIERIDGDIDAVTKFFSTAVLQLLGNAVLLAGVFVVAVVIDWQAGLLIGGAAMAATLTMSKLRHAAVPAHDAEREVNGDLYGDLEERLGGLEDLRANGAGEYAVHRLQHHSSRWWHAARRAAWLGDGAYVAAGAVFAVGSAATLALGVYQHRRGALSVGAVLILFRFAQMVREPLERIAEQMREFQKALAGARRASRLLATRPAIVDGPERPLGGGPLAVDFDHVTFAYRDGRTVLADIDLHLPPGVVLGVVGRTGSGKTTLGRLLLRFWDVTEGAVRVGGVDVRHTTAAELRRRVAVVTQEVELFRASVRDNLTVLGTIEADDARLIGVLDDLGLGSWLATLPAGLDTVLDGNAGLSSGEAQLLAFARAMLVDPGVVVLDEASSRLDPRTEERVVVATERLLAGRTVVIIAHRLATLERADLVLVLDGGRVAELGAPAVLAADPTSRYAALLAAAGAGLEAPPPLDPAGAGSGGGLR